jgi:Zn-dependent metalloprotease
MIHFPRFALCSSFLLGALPITAWARGTIYVSDGMFNLMKYEGNEIKGVRILEDGQPTKELAIVEKMLGRGLQAPEGKEAFRNLDLVQQFYESHFGRNSYDGNGAKIEVFVKVGRYVPARFDKWGYQKNAAWMSSSKVFLFGGGSDELSSSEYKSFSTALDVVGHEYTHAVISSTSQLVGHGQAWALNEHLADVFGVMIRHFYHPELENPFLLGAEVYSDAAEHRPIRNMKDPHQSARWQPAQMSEVSPTNFDPHYLAGVPNRAAAQILEQIGWEKSERLFYNVMTIRLKNSSTFGDYRKAMEEECATLYDLATCEVVSAAFESVGITQATAPTQAPAPAEGQ